VVVVDDQGDEDVTASEGGVGDPGIARPRRPHRIKEMGDRARATVEGAVGRRGVGVGVSAGDDDPAGDERVDQHQRPRQLRRQGDLGHRPGGKQSLQHPEVRREDRAGVVRSRPRRRQEGPLQMNADDPRPSGRLGVAPAWLILGPDPRHPPQRVDHRLDLRGDDRRLEGGDAIGEQCGRRDRVAVLARRREIDPRTAVHLQVDEPRRRDLRPPRHPDADRREAPVDHLDIAVDQLPVDQRRSDPEPQLAPFGFR
jgi:hypothetical protein